MRLRVIGISAAATLVAIVGLFLVGRGGHDSSAATVAVSASSAPTAATVPRRRDPKRSAAGARAQMTASQGPYRDPFTVPTSAATVKSSTGGGARGQSAASPPPSPAEAGSSPAASPGPVQSTPKAPETGPNPSPNPSPTPSHTPGGAAGSTPAQAPPGPAQALDMPAAAILRLVIPGHDPRTVALGAQGVLPSRSNPLLAVLRVLPARRQAVLMLAADVRPEGQAKCSPSAERCRSLTMSVGRVQLLQATSQDGEHVLYRLLLVRVRGGGR